MTAPKFIKSKVTGEKLYSLLYPEVRRKVIERIAKPKYVFKNLLPVERVDTDTLKWYAQTGEMPAPEDLSLEGGAGYPIGAVEVTEYTAGLKRYGIGVEISDWDVRHAMFNLLRIHLEDATDRMVRYLDKWISKEMEDAVTTTNGHEVATSGIWTGTSPKPKEDVAKAIRIIREDNYEPDTLVLSPKAYEALLTTITVAEEWTAGIIREGRLATYLGLNVLVSNNKQTESSILVAAKNKFGFLAEAIPLSTDQEYVKRTKMHYIYIEAMHLPVITRYQAIAEVTGVI